MDEEELQKRFTDCVYFLASPLTCKKGIECEFRHNEIARLNPRDCWYWLGGCCYNPECAFRHPPLEGLKEAYHEPLNPNHGSGLPVEKTNVPCYFYSKGFCNKADRCPFLHEPSDGNKPIVKNEAPCEIKLPAGTTTGAPPVQFVDIHPDPPVTALVEHAPTNVEHTPDSHQSPSGSESVGSEENVEPEEFVAFVQSESDVYNDHSSDGYVEPEKWSDLSPGFDVGRQEYEEDDVDFFSVNDEEHRELSFRYPDYEHFDQISGPPRVSIFNRLSFKKRNSNNKLIFNVQRRPDIHDRLKKTNIVGFDRRINFRPREFRGEVDFNQRGWVRTTVPVNRYKPPQKKPRVCTSEVPRLRRQRQQGKGESREETAVFTGPKTLDQIKEEKKKSRENGEFRSDDRTGSDGVFQGPRPLSEILKNKRKLL